MPIPGTELREGYELWRPNREKAEAKGMKLFVAVMFFASAALLIIITVGGWQRLEGAIVGIITLAWAFMYIAFGVMVYTRWQRGVLPLTAALAVIMIIFAAVSAGGWFARNKVGFDDPALPSEVIGLLVLLVIPVQVILIIVCLVAFNQNWHVEEERPIGGHGGHDASGDAPSGGEPATEAALMQADDEYYDELEPGEGWGPPEPAPGI